MNCVGRAKCISLTHELRGYMYRYIILTFELRGCMYQPCTTWVHISALHLYFVGICISLIHMHYVDTCISFTYALHGFMYQYNICISWVHELAYIYYVGACISQYVATFINLTYALLWYMYQPFFVATYISLTYVLRGYMSALGMNSWVHVSAFRMKYVGTGISLTYELRICMY